MVETPDTQPLPMTGPRLIRLTSLDDLRAAAPLWDDLWRRSGVTAPTVRAEALALWVQQFAPQSSFLGLVVEDAGEWVAALPLVYGKVWRVLSAATMPINHWTPPSGALLLDTEAEPDAALDAILAAVRELSQQLIWLDELPLEAARWKAFHHAVDRAGMPCDLLDRYQVGMIAINHDWEAYRMQWSGRHRRNMGRAHRELQKRGEVQFQMLSQLEPGEVEEQLHTGFGVEDRGWKAQSGSSVFRCGMFDFFVRQAKLLAEWGQLELVFLRSDERPIAFCYGLNAKGVFHPFKIGYDPEFSFCSPGQLLFHNLLEQLHHDPQRKALDFSGPLKPTYARWRPVPYTVGHLVVAPRRLLGRSALYAYANWWPLARRLKNRLRRDR